MDIAALLVVILKFFCLTFLTAIINSIITIVPIRVGFCRLTFSSSSKTFSPYLQFPVEIVVCGFTFPFYTASFHSVLCLSCAKTIFLYYALYLLHAK